MISPPFSQGSEIPIDSMEVLHRAVEGLFDWHTKLGFAKVFPVSRNLLFRGHANLSWPLSTTLERSNFPPDVRSYYNWVRDIQPRVEAFSGRAWMRYSEDDFETWFATPNLWRVPYHYEFLLYLRHHGFYSPLIDWTQSPYVALYFTVTGHDASRSRESACIYVLCPKVGELSDTDPTTQRYIHDIGAVVHAHQRHFLQRCEYTYCLESNDIGEPLFLDHEGALARAGTNVYWARLVLHRGVFDDARRYLVRNNIDAFSLFGGEDALIQSLAEFGPID
jgi:hypothetical protein